MTRSIKRLLFLLLLAPFVAAGATAASEQSTTLVPEDPGSDDQVVVGVQGVDVDATGDRDDKFEEYREVPESATLDFFRFSRSSTDGKDFFQVKLRDAAQEDMRLHVRSGLGALRFDADWIKLPKRYGSQGRFVLGAVTPDQFRIADFIQGTMENPDGNGVPFYSEPGYQPDNDMVFGLTNQLLEGYDAVSVASRRNVGRFDLAFKPSPSWDFRIEGSREWRDGTRPAGSGTYQRISDVNGDGKTDYDYFFSVRGVELPMTVQYQTTDLELSGSYASGSWFGQAQFHFQDFDNDFMSQTYDNPFWITDTLASSGSRRGLWNFARMSTPPSNQAWNVNLQGGFVFSRGTQLTAVLSRGRISQDDNFLPITTNTALIGTKDLNGDGVIDAQDDPTTTTVFQRKSLGAEVDTTMLGVVFSSRSKRFGINARAHYYDYSSNYDTFTVPARAEYVESRLKDDFKGSPILHIPINFSRTRFNAEAIFKASPKLRFGLLAERVQRDYDQYQDVGDNVSRELGTRAVSGTGDNRIAATVYFAGNANLGGFATYRYSNRTHDGTYQAGFSGEIAGMRQYDIADRKRNAFTVNLDLFASQPTNLNLVYDYVDDDFPESEYGRQSAKGQGLSANLNLGGSETLNVFVWGEWSKYEVGSHLRTKCSNCAAPPGAGWSPPWEVPNFDWFSDYTDTTLGLGAGLDYTGEKWLFEARGWWVKGTIEQLTRNPGTPLDLANPGETAYVALGYDFPDQENEQILAELKLTRKVNEKVSFGAFYWLDVFNMTDFMWDGMDPYGPNFLSVDDATRIMYLNARYADYTANVLQGFLKVTF